MGHEIWSPGIKEIDPLPVSTYSGHVWTVEACPRGGDRGSLSNSAAHIGASRTDIVIVDGPAHAVD